MAEEGQIDLTEREVGTMSKPKMTESKFKAIKILLESGETHRNIAKMMDVSSCLVSYVMNAENFEEYKHKIYVSSGAYRAKMKAEEERKRKAQEVAEKVGAVKCSEIPVVKQEPVQQVKQTVTIQATHYMMEELRTMNETLKLISNKLAFIVDELTGVKKDA